MLEKDVEANGGLNKKESRQVDRSLRFVSDVDILSLKARVDAIYNDMISSLVDIADKIIPKRKVNFLKYWWNEEGTLLKNDSIETHRLWIENGRPNTGPIYENKNKARNRYRFYIRQNKNSEMSTVSNILHDALIQKDGGSFWKTWNSKFKSRQKTASSIEGLHDDHETAENRS